MNRNLGVGCLMFAALASTTAGCELFRGSPAPIDANVDAPGADAAIAGSPWSLGTFRRGPYEPGTWVTFLVDGVTVPPEDVSLWIVEQDREIPFYVRRSTLPPAPEVSLDDEGGLPDAGAALDAGVLPSYVFATPLPIVEAGVFHLAVGTAEGPLTREVEVEVVLGTPRLTHAEAGDALGLGLSGFTTDVSALLHSDVPEWQELLASDLEATALVARFDGTVDDLDALAAVAREEYMDLPADLEPGLQQFLWNSGFLQSLSARASGTSMTALGSGLTGALIRSPLQGVLFSLDVVSMLLASFGLVCDVAAILGGIITAPVGGEGALPGVAAKVAMAVLRVTIDGFLPSDVGEIFQVQASTLVFSGEGSMVVPWARFTPQNTRLGSTVRSFEDLVIACIEASTPGGAAPARMGIRELLRRMGEYIVAHIPGFMLEFVFSGLAAPMIELALPLDMGFYNITLSQVIQLNPVFAPMAAAMVAIYDPELVSPYDVTARTTGATTSASYGTWSVGIDDIEFASTAATEQVTAILRVRAFGFGTEGAGPGDFQIVQFPFPYTVDAATRILRVQQAPDPANPSQFVSDEDFVMLDVNLVGGGTSRVLRPSTTAVRVYTMQLNDLSDGVAPDPTVVDIVVNGSPQLTGYFIADPASVPLVLQPGLNSVDVVAIAGHTVAGLQCSGGREVCVSLTFPEADNANHQIAMHGPVGTTRSFRIWTPPTYPTE